MSKDITQKQIDAWKSQYGTVYALPVDDKTVYLRQPNMLDWKQAFTAMQDDGEIGFSESLLKTLIIGGDDEVLKNDEYFSPARKALAKMFRYDEAETKELENRQTEIKLGEHRCVVRVITREDLRLAEKRNPSNKPLVTQEQLFNIIKIEADPVFDDRNNAEIRMPLYEAIEKLQNKKIAQIKKL
ncbi:hypothetical protein QP547_04675 [Weeksella virosa]|uniref:hypothetical protein n=1 Tax=Weeksella virosa TaxID=1014 RepID=UPI002557BDF7|nr:hypothetical protein [Weeksella virosa]MDK7675104.1 hypothetical protein [Weeksella virosa]